MLFHVYFKNQLLIASTSHFEQSLDNFNKDIKGFFFAKYWNFTTHVLAVKFKSLFETKETRIPIFILCTFPSLEKQKVEQTISVY